MAKKKEDKTALSAELMDAINELNKSYGEGSLSLINEAPNMTIERIPTGSLVLDSILGSGWPKSKIIELLGENGSGKSTICWHFLSQFPGPKLYVDTEQSLDKEYGARIGCDLSNLIINQCETLEEGLEIVLALCDKVDAIVFDSVTEAATKLESESDFTSHQIGTKAKIMSKMMRLIKGKTHSSTMLFTSQIRIDPSITYGSNRVTSGGNALRFASHVRLDLYGKEMIRKGSGETAEVIGQYSNIKLVKSKISPPFVKCQVPIMFDGRGISREQEVIDIGIEKGIITKAGSWIKYGDANLAQGVENCRLMLMDNAELREELELKIKSLT